MKIDDKKNTHLLLAIYDVMLPVLGLLGSRDKVAYIRSCIWLCDSQADSLLSAQYLRKDPAIASARHILMCTREPHLFFSHSEP
jgi:hypothetical protein